MTSRRRDLLITLLVCAVLPGAAPAIAATFTVTRPDDPVPDACLLGDCSLREAVIAANGSPGPDDIDLPADAYLLALPDAGGIDENAALTGDLDVSEDLSILASGNAIIDAPGLPQAFHLASGETLTAGPVTIQGAEAVGFFGAFVPGGQAQISGSVDLIGHVVTGDMTYVQSASSPSDTEVGVANAEFFFGESEGTPDETGLRLSNASGAALILLTGSAGSLTGTPQFVGTPDLGITGTAALHVNETPSAINTVVDTAAGPVILDLPEGPFERVDAIGTQLGMLGQSLSGDFAFEKSGADLVGVGTNGALLLSSGGAGVRMSDLTSFMLIQPAGTFGLVGDGTTSLVGIPGLSLLGTFALRLNSSSSAIQEQITVGGSVVDIDLPAGPFVRVEGQGVQLELFSFTTFSGEFSFEEVGPGLVASGPNVTSSIGLAPAPTFELANGVLGMLIASDGTYAMTAGFGSATLVGLPGITFNGTATLRSNTTGTVVDEVIPVPGGDVILSFPDGRLIREARFDPPITPVDLDDWLETLAALSPPASGDRIDIHRGLDAGVFTATRSADVPSGYRMVLDGNGGGATLTGASPALSIKSGEVMLVNNIALEGASDASVLLVNGGSLFLRGCTVQETGLGQQTGIDVRSGSADLGTASDPGMNLVAVEGDGDFIRNAAPGPVSALGNTFEFNSTPMTDPFDIESRIFHALDAGGGGLVTYVADNVYRTLAQDKVFTVDLQVLVADLSLPSPSFELIGATNGVAELTVSPAEFTPAPGHLGDAGFTYAVEQDGIEIVQHIVNLRYVPTAPADFDRDLDVDADDLAAFEACASGPAISGPPVGCMPDQFYKADMDDDNDVDQTDFGIFQRCFSGENNPADPNCAN